MNYIDIILFILLALSAIVGFRKGLVVELASLAALILGIWGAIKFSGITSGFLVEQFNVNWDHLPIISFAITFVVIVILVHMIGAVVDKLVKTVMLGFVNRLAGLVFGIARGALFLSIVLLIVDHVDREVHLLPESAKAQSRMYEPIKNFAPSLLPFIDFWNDEDFVPGSSRKNKMV